MFLLIIMLVSFMFLVISLIKIIKWQIDNNNTNTIINKIKNTVDIKEVDDDENTEIINKDVDEDNPYWDYIKIKLIDVDFDILKEINKDTVGWIQVAGTNINYPFVQTSNNTYYLTHSLDKTYNKAGWVFLDYRNNINNLDKNTIIYAHGRKDTTMFGSLKDIFTDNWLENKNNYVIKISTEKENSLWQIFSTYIIDTTNDYIKIDFDSDTEYEEFLEKIIKRSSYNFNTSIDSSDKILTLSTCYSSTQKIVVHAKLIKKATK